MVDCRDFLIEMARIKVRMLCSFPYTKRLCGDFLVDGSDYDIVAKAGAEEIEAESAQYPEGSLSRGYCEGVCLYRSIAEQIPSLDGLVFHGAAVDIDGKGVVFSAPSGTGKTTHISLLMKNYPEAVRVINGDKPIIRKIDGQWSLFPTPWAGKEGWKSNLSSPIRAIVVLERGKDNYIEEIEPEKCFEQIVGQTYLPRNIEARIRTLDLLDEMSKAIRFYRLSCNMDDSAAEVSYNMLK